MVSKVGRIVRDATSPPPILEDLAAFFEGKSNAENGIKREFAGKHYLWENSSLCTLLTERIDFYFDFFLAVVQNKATMFKGLYAF